ncbi:MAG: hypothetical protein JKY19_03170 [Alcanivoracaceae bacterium]|nr:hypothetical protein [Alcanivoracaceae bacterium]
MKIKSFILLATLLAAILPQTSHATMCTDAMATMSQCDLVACQTRIL